MRRARYDTIRYFLGHGNYKPYAMVIKTTKRPVFSEVELKYCRPWFIFE